MSHYQGIIQEHECKEEHFHLDDKEVLSVHTQHTHVYTHTLFGKELSQNDDSRAVNHKPQTTNTQQYYK